MKKFWGILLSIIWFGIGVFVIGFMVSSIRGSWPRLLAPIATSIQTAGWTGGSVKSTGSVQKVFEQSWPADRINQIKMDLVSEHISIAQGTSNHYQVTIFSNYEADLSPTAYLEGSKLVVDYPKKDWWKKKGWGWPNRLGYSGRVELTVPQTADMSLLNEFSVESVSGKIEMRNVAAQKLDLESVSGSIVVDGALCRELEMQTTSGSISYTGSADTFDVDSTSGSVKIALSAMFTQESEVETVSGSIKIILPENEGFAVRSSSVSGRYENEFSGVKGSRDLTDQYKGAFPLLKLETVSGSREINRQR